MEYQNTFQERTIFISIFRKKSIRYGNEIIKKKLVVIVHKITSQHNLLCVGRNDIEKLVWGKCTTWHDDNVSMYIYLEVVGVLFYSLHSYTC